MKTYFSTPTVFDLRALTLMGVSVKPGETAIGEFGTGLKYAIAVCLRFEQKVTLYHEGTEYIFQIKEISFRGRTIQQIYMNDIELPFTLAYGKDWKLWEAYRELASNTLDEGGTIGGKLIPGQTVFCVEGDAFAECAAAHRRYFFSETVDFSTESLDLHNKPSRCLYYKGVLVLENTEPFAHTYNIKNGLTLTENRTVSITSAVSRINKTLTQADDPSFFLRIALDPENQVETYDYMLSHSINWASPAVKEALIREARNPRLHPAVEKCVRQHLLTFDASVVKVTPSSYEQAKIVEARSFLASAFAANVDPILVETIPGAYACVESGKIYISRQAVDNGVDFLISTLLEEWLHKEHHLRDCTRELQQWLFDRVTAQARELNYLRNAQA